MGRQMWKYKEMPYGNGRAADLGGVPGNVAQDRGFSEVSPGFARWLSWICRRRAAPWRGNSRYVRGVTRPWALDAGSRGLASGASRMNELSAGSLASGLSSPCGSPVSICTPMTTLRPLIHGRLYVHAGAQAGARGVHTYEVCTDETRDTPGTPLLLLRAHHPGPVIPAGNEL